MTQPVRLNLVEGSVSFRFTVAAAQDLKKEIDQLLLRLRTIASEKSAGNRPDPQPVMEYQHTGDIFLEVFCNPNIWAGPFAAKVLLTLRDDRIRITTEAELTRLIDDLNQYLDEA